MNILDPKITKAHNRGGRYAMISIIVTLGSFGVFYTAGIFPKHGNTLMMIAIIMTIIALFIALKGDYIVKHRFDDVSEK